MKRNRQTVSFAIIGICIVIMYIVSMSEVYFLNDKIDSGDRFLCVLLTVVAIASFVGCIHTAKNIANSDTLTGIGNVNWIIAKGGKLHAKKKIKYYAALFINLKDCKYMNEKFGNAVGDKIIHDYAQEIQRWLDKKGYVGRMGGDNFFVFVKSEYLDDFLEHLHNIVISVRYDDEPVLYKVKVRCGIVQNTDDVSYRDIINQGSTALSNARQSGTDFVRYEMSMQKDFVEEKQILADFKRAVHNREFIPYYQPKVDAKTQKLCGAEALVRWFKDGKMIMPGKFIPILERNNRIPKLDFCIFEQVCRDLRGWLDAGMEPVCVSSNFSIKNLKNEHFAEEIIRIVKKYKLDGHYLEVELTESSCMEDFELLKSFSKKVKHAGIKLAIDDFGTGYSSLSMLHEFDADIVKLDKSFLDSAISGDEKNRTFIRDVIGMVDNQDKDTLCEGVETKEQLEFLKEAGCKVIQGYYFDKPLPKEEFEKRIKQPQYEK